MGDRAIAIDTVGEKLSLMEWNEPYEMGLPQPSGDSSISTADKQHLLMTYAATTITDLWVDVSEVTSEIWVDI